MGAFFKRFSCASLYGRLPRVEVPGWVVQPQSFWGVLLNQQKLAIFFNNGCNGDAGLPACWRGLGGDLLHKEVAVRKHKHQCSLEVILKNKRSGLEKTAII
jgi:hypothetical protein